MASGTTSRLALPYPVPIDPTNIPGDVQSLATALDGETVVFLTPNTFANRPANPVSQSVYYATDTKQLFWYTGSTWIPSSFNFGYGTTAARPAAGAGSRLYYATDTAVLWYDTGSTWVQINTVINATNSNIKDVGTADTAGASGLNADASHIHRGVASLSSSPSVAISGGDGAGHGALTPAVIFGNVNQIQPTATSASAGSTGVTADAGHVHGLGQAFDTGQGNNNYFPLWGIGSGWGPGGIPPASANPTFLMQAGTAIVTTNGGSGWAIGFPNIFPNGIMMTMVCWGDTVSGGPTGPLACIGSQSSTSGQGGIAFGYANQTIRINWIAIGF